jgi:hypothetical protein
MQRSLRLNDVQLLALAEKSLHDNGLKGYLFKKSSEGNRWQLRWFVLFQNLFFYFESEQSIKPIGLIFLEGSYCDKTSSPGTSVKGTSTAGQVIAPTSLNPRSQFHWHFRFRSVAL